MYTLLLGGKSNIGVITYVIQVSKVQPVNRELYLLYIPIAILMTLSTELTSYFLGHIMSWKEAVNAPSVLS